MTIAAAWVEACRLRPSSFSEVSISSRCTSLRSRTSCRRGSCLRAALRSEFGPPGISLAISSASPKGISSTRATSRTTARALRLPKVITWATRSDPYFRVM